METCRFEDLEAARASGPKIVAIGGGTGLSAMLRGLKRGSENLTAIVTVADDGGGSGQLRQDLGMPPPGDIRNCILALANVEPMMQKLLNYRFTDGSLAGQSFGNLFLAALNGIYDTFDEAVERMSEVLAITGKVLPVTNTDVYLEAEFENGSTVLGESKILGAKKREKSRIKKVRLRPDNPPALPAAIKAIEDADLIILGPGSLYTSIIPNLLVAGVADAVANTAALRVYVCNIMTQEGESEGYTAFDHARALMGHGRPHLFDIALCNSAPVSEEMRTQYLAEGANPTVIDRELFIEQGIELRERPLIEESAGVVRHNPLKLAYTLFELLREKRLRAGLYGKMDEMVLNWLRQEL